MTPLELNALGFEGDRHLRGEFQRLINKHHVEVIVETGTYLANTTMQLNGMAELVFTVESNEEYYNASELKLKNSGVLNYFGSSVDMLPGILNGNIFKEYCKNTPLVFLDAHWGDNNPLIRELEIIAEAKLRPVIIIHDFKVPDHPELGFDSYGGQDYEWSWIEKAVENIYGPDGYTYHYNTQAEGAKRGVIFIEPK